jgi:methylamine dehydrogenase heavy chain
MPNLAQAALSDDDRFLAVYNFTPSQSLSIVDTRSQKLVQEVNTAGCSLVYPGGDRTFHMLCGNGGMLTLTLNDDGEVAEKQRSDPFFDVEKDFVTEKAVRYGDQWLFVSWNGYVYPVDVSDNLPEFGERWSLLTDEQRAENWKIGGLQHLAVHQSSGRFYSLMHQGGVDTHKDPGTEVWVYDLASRNQVQTIALKNIATSIQVSQDHQPLFYSIFIGSPSLDIYDATSGEYLRTVEELGFTPTVLQTPRASP